MLKQCHAFLILGFAAFFATASSRAQDSYNTVAINGAVMLPDDRTLIVSFTSAATLAYYDTDADKELKEVEVEFQPTSLAIQGERLFAAVKGAAIIHVLDPATGKETAQIKLPGEPVTQVACHPQKGFLYALNSNDEVFAIDPSDGTSTKTAAKGQMLAVDPNNGKYVYTGSQKPIRDGIIVEEQRPNSFRVSVGQSNLRAGLFKYEVMERNLKLLANNDNPAINGRGLAVSPDGKRIAMAGGGGWRSKTDSRANYSIAVFETADMQSFVGQLDTGPYPVAVAFHPVLNIVAAYHDGNAEVILFSSKSFARKSAFKVQRSGPTAFLLFGGHGGKVIYASSGLLNDRDRSELVFIPLKLSEQDRQMLSENAKKTQAAGALP